MEKSPSCENVYFCQSFERYGILPSLNAIFTAFLGSVWVSLYLEWNSKYADDQYESDLATSGSKNFSANKPVIESKKPKIRIPQRLVFFSALNLVVCGILQLFPDIFIISPLLYSFNYMVLNIGISSSLLLVFHLLEIYSLSNFSLLEKIGKNAIFLIFISTVLLGRYPFGFENKGSHTQALISTFVAVGVWFLVGHILGMFKFYFKF